eukprot:4156357-Pyramimonas_sp.AAC.1
MNLRAHDLSELMSLGSPTVDGNAGFNSKYFAQRSHDKDRVSAPKIRPARQLGTADGMLHHALL